MAFFVKSNKNNSVHHQKIVFLKKIRIMKKYYIIVVALFVLISCGTKKPATFDTTTFKSDTIRIANDALEYEVLIIDVGFSGWLASYAKPRNYHSQNYMEQRNKIWVNQWNQNVLSGRRADLFEMSINYEANIDYGYEVNYLIYNYLTYFQLTNNIQLGGFKARL